jgi:hypothetical protein
VSVVDDQRARAGETDHLDGFLDAEQRVGRREHRTQLRDAGEERHGIDGVVAPHHHPIAVPHPDRRERVRMLVRGSIELAVGDRPLAERHGHVGGPGPRRRTEHVTDEQLCPPSHA